MRLTPEIEMGKCGLTTLPPWEQLFKRVLWAQLGQLRGKRILDFGSGIGVTANCYAADNEVIAVEPSAQSVAQRWCEHPYQQIVGSTDALHQMEDGSFDVIFCHNVLEYVPDREEILQEFHRLLKPDGLVSLVKHNRPGRVMQMVVLLNDFEKANFLLDGEDGMAANYGAIHYYEDEDVTEDLSTQSCGRVGWCEPMVFHDLCCGVPSPHVRRNRFSFEILPRFSWWLC
jgi:SAM-dependent methyltransferase